MFWPHFEKPLKWQLRLYSLGVSCYHKLHLIELYHCQSSYIANQLIDLQTDNIRIFIIILIYGNHKQG